MERHNNVNNVHCHEFSQRFSFCLDDTVSVPAVKRLHKNDDQRQFYTISKIKEQRMSNFKTLSTSYKVTFKDIEMTDEVMSTLKRFRQLSQT